MDIKEFYIDEIKSYSSIILSFRKLKGSKPNVVNELKVDCNLTFNISKEISIPINEDFNIVTYIKPIQTRKRINFNEGEKIKIRLQCRIHLITSKEGYNEVQVKYKAFEVL
jgi:hypothetical protein